MSPLWDDLNVRARGLATRLPTRGDLDAWARQPDLPALAAALARAGILPGISAGDAQAADLELGVRRWGAAALGILGRWAGARSEALPLVFADEDRRSLRALFRGAAARAPAERRLAGLLPTPALPERALEELAAAPTVGAASALLSAWRHPLAAAVAELPRETQPDLFTLEVALGRASAIVAARAAGRSGSRVLRSFVAESIDLENGRLALLLAGEPADLDAGALFIPGGARLIQARFLAAVRTRDPAAAGGCIAPAFSGAPYADAFEAGGRDPGRLEGELFVLQLRQLTRIVRQAPLEPTTTVWYAFRLRAAVIDLQRIIWTVALDAPRQALLDQLTTRAA